jgi:4-hydroxy-3-methylbut-2-enyl diphosphate reductase
MSFNHPLAGKPVRFEVQASSPSCEAQHADHPLANPRGFCAGVDRAIAIVERALEKFGAPIYVRHEVVHNRSSATTCAPRAPSSSTNWPTCPAAHGHLQRPRRLQSGARRSRGRGLRVFDATCPLVTKVHLEVARMRKEGREIIMIGHKGHPEVEGTMGQSPRRHVPRRNRRRRPPTAGQNPDRWPTSPRPPCRSTTPRMVIAALKARFPEIIGPKKDDICYATQNRQDAVKQLAGESDLVLVVGSPNSSNSNRLRKWRADTVMPLAGIEENVNFPLPKALVD